MVSAMAKNRAKETKLKITIEYIVEVQYFNAEQVLDQLREYGSAEIVRVEVVGPTDG